jgi:glutathione S-transferase
VAILEYLEVCFPHPALLPADPLQTARVRGLCNLVAADIHPLANMRVRSWIARGQGDAASHAWVQHWSQKGQEALEGFLTLWAGRHAVGDTLSMADFFVAPAVFSMLRLGCVPDADSRLAAVYREALLLPAFERLRTA